jgi:DNA polymerase elongation subunit (family B)
MYNYSKHPIDFILKMKDEDRIKELEQRLKRITEDITYFDTLQYTLKITLNSIYGTFANKHSPFMDIDNASSITLTGQAVAKAGSEILSSYAK